MAPRVSFHRIARSDLFGIYDYIEKQGGAARAGRYIDRIESDCRALTTFPEKGKPRDDIAPGLRTRSLERRVLIAYRTDGRNVEILRVLYAGRDFGAGDIPGLG